MSIGSKMGNGHKKRDAFIIALLIGAIAFAAFLKVDDDNRKSNQDVQTQANQKVIVANQKALARGLNTVGNIIINDVVTKIPEIKDKTDLIDDIKIDTSRILNTTILYNGSISMNQDNQAQINFTK